jgi:asparagine synthase (glutamine-hydrolysing)
MRHRYLAISNREGPAIAVELPTSSTKISLGPVTLLLAHDCVFTPFSDGRGIVVGWLFDRTGTPVKSLSAACCRRIASTHGAHLIYTFWGRYCCFFLDANDRVISIRDPSGGIPCYYHADSHILAQASFVDDLIGAGFCDGDVDSIALRRHLLRTQLRAAETPIRGIREMLRGERFIFDGVELRQDFAWRPWEFAHASPDMRFEEAVERVRLETLRSVRAQADPFRHIMLDVSGGLDSSIVAASLRHADALSTLVTFHSGTPRDDERPHARKVAEHLGYRLIEARLETGLVDLSYSASAHLPRPIARSFAQAGDSICQYLANEIGCDASFNGGGGDNIFFNLSTVDPIIEQIILTGFGPHLIETARSLSRITGSSLIEILRYTRSKWSKRNDPVTWGIEADFLDAQVVADAAEGLHPWLERPDGTTLGRCAHVAMLLRIENHLDGFARELLIPLVSPLLSQPIVELCLQIPSWLWVHGGRNRSVARQAFENLLPHSILQRTDHGSPIAFTAELFEERKRELEMLLLDGRLSGDHLIDRAQIEAYLRSSRPPHDMRFLRILALADIEAWLQARDQRRGSRSIFGPLSQCLPVPNVCLDSFGHDLVLQPK